eukprot:14001790-Alexandrium_andersonii.AAC.1
MLPLAQITVLRMRHPTPPCDAPRTCSVVRLPIRNPSASLCGWVGSRLGAVETQCGDRVERKLR